MDLQNTYKTTQRESMWFRAKLNGIEKRKHKRECKWPRLGLKINLCIVGKNKGDPLDNGTGQRKGSSNEHGLLKRRWGVASSEDDRTEKTGVARFSRH
jgi:hypothetical protein